MCTGRWWGQRRAPRWWASPCVENNLTGTSGSGATSGVRRGARNPSSLGVAGWPCSHAGRQGEVNSLAILVHATQHDGGSVVLFPARRAPHPCGGRWDGQSGWWGCAGSLPPMEVRPGCMREPTVNLCREVGSRLARESRFQRAYVAGVKVCDCQCRTGKPQIGRTTRGWVAVPTYVCLREERARGVTWYWRAAVRGFEGTPRAPLHAGERHSQRDRDGIADRNARCSARGRPSGGSVLVTRSPGTSPQAERAVGQSEPHRKNWGNI